jgi:hypothetical protein
MTDLEDKILKSEIFIKIEVTARKINKLSLETFPTLGPQNVLLLSTRILEQLLKRFRDGAYSLDQMILIKTGILRYIIDLIACIEYSTIKNVTWSIIPAYNRLFKSLRSDNDKNIEYIIVPQWEENYSIRNSNVIDDFQHFLETPDLIFEAGTSSEINKKMMDNIPPKVYLIQYARLEKLTALHLALLGHEIGHIFATRWINENYRNFAKNTTLSNRLETIVLDELKKSNVADDMFMDFLKSKKIDDYNRLITMNYRELLSDIFGCALFGHTYIIAMYLFSSITAELGKSNWDKGYLSWRYRLQNCVQFLSFVIAKYPDNQRNYDLYDSICSEIHGNIEDRNAHEVCNLLIESFRMKEDEIFSTICKYTGTQLFAERINNEQINVACDRLKHNIIPNAMLNDGIESPIDIRNILYAIWLVSYNDKENEPGIQSFSDDIQHYNLLGIKGIELSVEQEEYNDFIKRQTIRET